MYTVQVHIHVHTVLVHIHMYVYYVYTYFRYRYMKHELYILVPVYSRIRSTLCINQKILHTTFIIKIIHIVRTRKGTVYVWYMYHISYMTYINIHVKCMYYMYVVCTGTLDSSTTSTSTSTQYYPVT